MRQSPCSMISRRSLRCKGAGCSRRRPERMPRFRRSVTVAPSPLRWSASPCQSSARASDCQGRPWRTRPRGRTQTYTRISHLPPEEPRNKKKKKRRRRDRFDFMVLLEHECEHFFTRFVIDFCSKGNTYYIKPNTFFHNALALSHPLPSAWSLSHSSSVTSGWVCRSSWQGDSFGSPSVVPPSE